MPTATTKSRKTGRKGAATSSPAANGKAHKPANPKKKPSKYTAATADRHVLYQKAVQCVEAEIDFVDETYRAIRGKKASLLREDFCGTGNTSCEWVRRRRSNRAVGYDIDEPTLAWGREHNVGQLKKSQRERVELLPRNVMEPAHKNLDIVLAMNFSYWIFREREMMRRYFKNVRKSLADDGVFFLDFYGGSEAHTECVEETDHGDFVYIWDQDKYNPITGDMTCRIHFRFPDRTRMRDAFVYTWRLWNLPEIRDLLLEAGFKKATVYWEGDSEDEDDDGGNGEFLPTEEGEACPAFICYIVAEK